MGKKVRIQLAPGDQDRLEALIANGNTPQKHVRWARIVRLAGDGVGTDDSPLKKASLTGFHATAKHIAAKAVSPSSETMRTI